MPELGPPKITAPLRADDVSSRVDAFDATQAWVLVVVVLLGLAAACFRVVGDHQRAALVRFGRVVGVRQPGLRRCVPGVERLVVTPATPQRVAISVPASTRDGVRVQLVGSAEFRVVDAARAVGAEPEPRAAVGRVVEDALVRVVGRRDVTDLLPGADRVCADAQLVADESVRPVGLELTGVDLTAVETRLTSALVHALHRRPAGR